MSSSEEEDSNSDSVKERKKSLRGRTHLSYEEISDEEFFQSLEEESAPQIDESEAAKIAANAERQSKTMKAGK